MKTLVKDQYRDGRCPECQLIIPAKAVDNTPCKHCGHTLRHGDDFPQVLPNPFGEQ